MERDDILKKFEREINAANRAFLKTGFDSQLYRLEEAIHIAKNVFGLTVKEDFEEDAYIVSWG